MQTASTVSPSQEAIELAREMMGRDDIKRQILEETLDSAEAGQILESGRTVCGATDTPHGPLGRFPTSVELRRCPHGIGGAFHSHVTPPQLRSPSNSLADIALAVFTPLDVIQVTGTNTEEYFVVAGNEDEMQRRFIEAVGADSVSAVVEGVARGEIDPNAAQSAVRSGLSPLFLTATTGYPELQNRVASIEPQIARAPESYDRLEAMSLSARNYRPRDHMAWKEKVNHAGACAEEMAPEGLSSRIFDQAIGTTVGLVVGRVVEGILFE